MGYLRYENEQLVFGLSDTHIKSFTQSYQGPTYIYDLPSVTHRLKQMQSELKNVHIFYAMKANSHPEILSLMASQGIGADVVSLGEIRRAMQSGFAAENIIYSGVGKTRHEIKTALELGISQINVESLPELVRIVEIAKSLQKKAAIALRLNPDVDIKTHPYIATGLKDNKFGMELSLLPNLKKIISENKEHIQFRGISLHLGSQMLEFAGFAEALEKLKNVFLELKAEFPEINAFDIGGGLGVFYEKQDLQSESVLLKQYSEIVFNVLKPLCDQGVNLQTEPGRWLVAHSGVLLTQVQYIKETNHKTFVIVDSGMNHLMRPSLYDAHHGIWSVIETDEKVQADLVGPICESGDFFAKDRHMPKLQADDFIVIADTGAYGYSMANHYNLHDLPREIVIK